MNNNRAIVLCWNCSKEHEIIYKLGNPIWCECGGTVLTNSGKIKIKIENENDDNEMICSECDYRFDEEEIEYCEECGGIVCENCILVCRECKINVCRSCYSSKDELCINCEEDGYSENN